MTIILVYGILIINKDSKNSMTDEEFKCLMNEMNEKNNVKTVGELIAWLNHFPHDMTVGFGYATIEAFLEDKCDGSTEQLILIDEMA